MKPEKISFQWFIYSTWHLFDVGYIKLHARIERTGASFKVTGAQKRTQEWLFVWILQDYSQPLSPLGND